MNRINRQLIMWVKIQFFFRAVSAISLLRNHSSSSHKKLGNQKKIIDDTKSIMRQLNYERRSLNSSLCHTQFLDARIPFPAVVNNTVLYCVLKHCRYFSRVVNRICFCSSFFTDQYGAVKTREYKHLYSDSFELHSIGIISTIKYQHEESSDLLEKNCCR